MKAGDRVMFEERGARGPQFGTIRRRSQAGYITVEWDDGTNGRFSPWVAALQLQPAEGDDARPRHVWNDDDVCEACGAQQTDENEFAPCDAPTAVRSADAGA